jgi:hypothetical protein
MHISQQSVDARRERAVTLFESGVRPVEKAEELLMRARMELVELKRTGSRQVLPELLADVTKLKNEIEQLRSELESR